jgi:hypothetical protein
MSRRYHAGDFVLVKGSSKGPALVLAASPTHVLVGRETGQWGYAVDEVEPYVPKKEICNV